VIKDPLRRQFAGMLAAVDDGIKNVSAALERLRSASTPSTETFVVVTTDK
jgi:arylsulfatase A-like enzyme